MFGCAELLERRIHRVSVSHVGDGGSLEAERERERDSLALTFSSMSAGFAKRDNSKKKMSNDCK